MRTFSRHPLLVLVGVCLLAVLVFLLGTAAAQAQVWGSYLLLILVVFLWGRRRDIYIVAALASVLVLVEPVTGWRAAMKASASALPTSTRWSVSWTARCAWKASWAKAAALLLR